MTVNMEREDVTRNLVDIVNTMESVRVESLRNFHAADGEKLEYLRLASELASCMQDVIKENHVEDYVERVKQFMDDDLMLYYDPSQKQFWNTVEPDFSKALADLSVVVMKDDYVSEGCVHHFFQGLKYLLAPSDKKEEIYTTIQPFNNLLSEELLSHPEVAQYVMKKVLLEFVEQSPEGCGMALQNTKLDTPEFVERLREIGALYVDIPHSAFGKMRKAFPNSTTVGEGKDKKARVIFTPEVNGSARNMFEFFSRYAQMDFGDAEACMERSVKNLYSFGKDFLAAMKKEIGIDETAQKTRTLRKAGGPVEITKQGDVYIVSNITLYDMDESVHTTYPEISIDASPVKEGRNIARKTQPQWLDFYAGKDKTLPSLPLLYAILEAAYDNKDEDAAKELLKSLQSDFKDSWLVTSTRFNYDQKKVWHNVTTQDQIDFDVNIPGISDYLENLVTQEDWAQPLRGIFMTRELEKIPKVFSIYGNRKGYLYTPDDNRKVERAAFVGFNYDDFSVVGDSNLDNDGRSRGVSAGGA